MRLLPLPWRLDVCSTGELGLCRGRGKFSGAITQIYGNQGDWGWASGRIGDSPVLYEVGTHMCGEKCEKWELITFEAGHGVWLWHTMDSEWGETSLFEWQDEHVVLVVARNMDEKMKNNAHIACVKFHIIWWNPTIMFQTMTNKHIVQYKTNFCLFIPRNCAVSRNDKDERVCMDNLWAIIEAKQSCKIQIQFALVWIGFNLHLCWMIEFVSSIYISCVLIPKQIYFITTWGNMMKDVANWNERTYYFISKMMNDTTWSWQTYTFDHKCI